MEKRFEKNKKNINEILKNANLFRPNYLSSKLAKIKINQMIKLDALHFIKKLYTANKYTAWRVENKNYKNHIPQEAKYDYEQIVKNYQLNKEQLENGYNGEYLNLLADLLYKNDHKTYAKNRLALIEFRKKVLKNKLSTSYENFIENENLSLRSKTFCNYHTKGNKYIERFHKSLLTAPHTKRKRLIEKEKQKQLILSSQNKKNPLDILYELNSLSSTDNNKRNSIFSTSIPKDNTSYEKGAQNMKKKFNSQIKKLFDKKSFFNTQKYITSASNYNSSNYYSSNEESLLSDNKQKTKEITRTEENEDDDEDIFLDKLNNKEKFLKTGDKQKYTDFLKTSYNFFDNRTDRELKFVNSRKRRTAMFNFRHEKVELPPGFPFRKEFFHKFNRINKRKKENDSLLYNNTEY